jgi:hypothetical protein
VEPSWLPGQKGIRILAPMLGTKCKKDSEAEKDITKQDRLWCK